MFYCLAYRNYPNIFNCTWEHGSVLLFVGYTAVSTILPARPRHLFFCTALSPSVYAFIGMFHYLKTKKYYHQVEHF